MGLVGDFRSRNNGHRWGCLMPLPILLRMDHIEDTTNDVLLLEAGDNILLETDDNLVLEEN